MRARENVPFEVYKRPSLDAFRYFNTAYSNGESFLSTLRREDDEFGTMSKIFELGGTMYPNYLESIIKPLEKAGFLSCNYASGYCIVTYEGMEAFEKFNTAANRLDMILRSIRRNIDWPDMKVFDKKYVIPEGAKRLREFIHRYGPFRPTGNMNPFIEAFIESGGNLHAFIRLVASLPHILAFLLTAEHIIRYETIYETFALDCKYLQYSTEKEIKEILSSGDRYPTGERIKEILREYMKEHDIPELKSPLQSFSMFGLIENVENEVFCACGTRGHYKGNRYRLTERGENLAKYIAIHILLS